MTEKRERILFYTGVDGQLSPVNKSIYDTLVHMDFCDVEKIVKDSVVVGTGYNKIWLDECDSILRSKAIAYGDVLLPPDRTKGPKGPRGKWGKLK